MRLRLTFSKTDDMRYTGHLDLHRAWERTIRRAQLPLAYSQGFNPRPKINLAAALPLGFTSDCELIDIWLDDDLPESQVEAHLREASPPGIEIHQVAVVPNQGPKLPALVQSAEYIITLTKPIEDLPSQIQTISELKILTRERHGKAYNLRPLIESIEEIDPAPDGDQRIRMVLAARSSATGRPDEVLRAINYPPNQANIHRSNLILLPR